MGEYLARDERLTLGFLTEKGVFGHKEQISTIADNAANENVLENMIKKIESIWQRQEFKLSPHKEIKDMYLVVETDELWVTLEESQTMMSSLKGSRYLAPYRTQVEELDSMLSAFSDALEQLILCQKNWIYLENIFVAPDIQRQLPNEARLFTVVDKSFKELMRRAADFSNCIKCLQSPGVCDALSLANSHLETILKCLEDYLEMKRGLSLDFIS